MLYARLLGNLDDLLSSLAKSSRLEQNSDNHHDGDIAIKEPAVKDKTWNFLRAFSASVGETLYHPSDAQIIKAIDLLTDGDDTEGERPSSRQKLDHLLRLYLWTQ